MDDELRRAERAVAETGHAEARLALARQLARVGRPADDVIAALLPALDDRAVKAELRRFAKERRCLEVGSVVVESLVARLREASCASFLLEVARSSKERAREVHQRARERLYGSSRRVNAHVRELEEKTRALALEGEPRFIVVGWATGSDDEFPYTRQVEQRVIDRHTEKTIYRFPEGDVTIEGSHVVVRREGVTERFRLPAGPNPLMKKRRRR